VGQAGPLSLLYPAVTLSLSDEDFGKLATGKANAQKLFMSGKLKIKGKMLCIHASSPSKELTFALRQCYEGHGSRAYIQEDSGQGEVVNMYCNL
jgi:SCP-2 sterol transfer family